MDVENRALLAAGALTRFVMVHVTASSEPAEPEGRPAGCPAIKDILSSVATASKVTEEAVMLFAVELT